MSYSDKNYNIYIIFFLLIILVIIYLSWKTENFESGDFSNFSDKHIPVWYKAIDHLPYVKKLCFDFQNVIPMLILSLTYWTWC